jgi:hypothetical protein
MRLQDVVLESRFNALIISKIFLTVLANLAAAFRIGFRLWWIKWPGADDVLVGFAAVGQTSISLGGLGSRFADCAPGGQHRIRRDISST